MMRPVLLILLFAACASAADPPKSPKKFGADDGSEIVIRGPSTVAEHSLVEFTPDGLPKNAVVFWEIVPRVKKRELPDGTIIFTAKPGQYDVTLTPLLIEPGQPPRKLPEITGTVTITPDPSTKTEKAADPPPAAKPPAPEKRGELARPHRGTDYAYLLGWLKEKQPPERDGVSVTFGRASAKTEAYVTDAPGVDPGEYLCWWADAPVWRRTDQEQPQAAAGVRPQTPFYRPPLMTLGGGMGGCVGSA